MRIILRNSRYHFLFLIILFLLLIVNINAKTPEDTKINPFYVDPATQDYSPNPELLERILSSPHGYFRSINIIFSNHVCLRFEKLLVGAPSLNLHGDAHIEQYAVTDLGRGLTDFDDSSTGPAILDWMRFGVSLQLACREHGWEQNSNELFTKFLKGYRDALNDPDIIAPEPVVVKRMQAKFTTDRVNYFKWVDSVMEPVPAQETDSLLIAIKPYVETMLAEQPDIKPDYFKVVKIGYLHMGIGSALDLKYLVRINGKSADPFDDVVLEVKEVRDLSGIECINTGQKIDPFRILLGQARIAYQPFHHLGYFYFRGLNFWVHSWVDNYKEVGIGKTFQSTEELAEVVYDVGVQLGKGHVKHIASPLDLQVRRKQLEILNRYEPEIKQVCVEFTKLIVNSWEEFKESFEKLR